MVIFHSYCMLNYRRVYLQVLTSHLVVQFEGPTLIHHVISQLIVDVVATMTLW